MPTSIIPYLNSHVKLISDFVGVKNPVRDSSRPSKHRERLQAIRAVTAEERNCCKRLVYGAGLLAVEVKPEWIVRGEVLDQFGALALSILRAGLTLGFSNV